MRNFFSNPNIYPCLNQNFILFAKFKSTFFNSRKAKRKKKTRKSSKNKTSTSGEF